MSQLFVESGSSACPYGRDRLGDCGRARLEEIVRGNAAVDD